MRNNHLKFTLIIFLVALTPHVSTGQDLPVAEIDPVVAPLLHNLRNSPGRKIQVQPNKRIYTTFETIWFNVQVLDSVSNKPLFNNNIIFADLVTEEDSVLQNLVLHNTSAQSTGSFEIIDTSLNGVYFLRAYTLSGAKEKNYNMGIYPIFITNGNASIATRFSEKQINPGNKSSVDTLVNIYPEGGHLISGIENMVTLKAFNSNGIPVKISFAIRDARNKLMVQFETNDKGIASFQFSPYLYGRYKVLMQRNGAEDSVTMLPRVDPFSMQLAVTSQSQQTIRARVLLEDSVFRNDYKTYLIGISRDSVCFAGIGKGNYELNIPAGSFPPGLATLLLFDEKYKAVSQRTIFIDKNNVIAKVETNRQVYSTREQGDIKISLMQPGGKPMIAALAVSVVPSQATDTFLSNEKYAGYSQAELIAMNIFDEQWFKDSLIQKPSRENFFTFSGQVLSGDKPAGKGLQVSLISNKDLFLVLQDTTDADGKFQFELPPFNDGQPFNVQVKNLNGQNEQYKVTFDKKMVPLVPTSTELKKDFYTDSSFIQLSRAIQTDSFFKSEGKQWLMPVIVKAEKQNDKRSAVSRDIITKEMLLAGGVNNIGNAVLASGKFQLMGGYLMYGGSSGFAPSATDEPLIVIDGMQISTGGDIGSDATESSPVLSYLKQIQPQQVDYIKLLSGAAAGMYGVRGGHGVIEIHTSTANNNSLDANGLIAVSLKGIHQAKNFETPDYSDKKNRSSKAADLRTTLYWNGDVITGANGTPNLQFYTSDIKGKYTVFISGTTAFGEHVFASKEFEVK